MNKNKFVSFYASLLLFSLILIAVQSCKKSKKATAIYIDNGMKNYFGYKAGSYWVYYDSVSNKTDSFFVINNVDFPPFWDYKTPNEENDIGILEINDSINWVIQLTGNTYA